MAPSTTIGSFEGTEGKFSARGGLLRGKRRTDTNSVVLIGQDGIAHAGANVSLPTSQLRVLRSSNINHRISRRWRRTALHHPPKLSFFHTKRTGRVRVADGEECRIPIPSQLLDSHPSSKPLRVRVCLDVTISEPWMQLHSTTPTTTTTTHAAIYTTYTSRRRMPSARASSLALRRTVPAACLSQVSTPPPHLPMNSGIISCRPSPRGHLSYAVPVLVILTPRGCTTRVVGLLQMG